MFLDPPYGYEKLADLVRGILTHRVFQVGALLIVEHGNTESEKAMLEALLEQSLVTLYRVLDCGDSSVWILEKV